MTTLALNRLLATLLGWSNIIENGGALLGTPPPGEYCVRNQCRVPDWAGDWRDCGPLMVAHCLNRTDSLFYVKPLCNTELWAGLAEYVGADAATRQTIVCYVIAKLEAACA